MQSTLQAKWSKCVPPLHCLCCVLINPWSCPWCWSSRWSCNCDHPPHPQFSLHLQNSEWKICSCTSSNQKNLGHKGKMKIKKRSNSKHSQLTETSVFFIVCFFLCLCNFLIPHTWWLLYLKNVVSVVMMCVENFSTRTATLKTPDCCTL